MEKVIRLCQRQVKTSANPAKKLALKFHQKEVVFVASQHLLGAGHTVKNQMNENAKNLSHRHDVPELNHHLMEGLRFPDVNRQDLVFFFIDSSLYPKRIQQRMQITQTVVKKNKVKTAAWQANSRDELSQTFELVQFGGFVNFYLAMLNGLNPSAIPWVDYFKTELGQSLGQWK
jgi:glucose/mannose-6-phosphate isomerase